MSNTEIDNLRKDLEELKHVSQERHMRVLQILIDIGSLKSELKDHDRRLGNISSFFGNRTTELRDRLTALETRFFKSIDDFGEVDRIIGRPESDPPDAQ